MSRVSPKLALLLLGAACAHGRDEHSGPDGVRISAPSMAVDTLLDDTLDPGEGDSTDWRAIDLEKPGQIGVQLHWDAEGSALEVTLHDGLGKEVARGEAAGARGLQLLHNAEEQGRYFVRVAAADRSPRTPYSLKLSYQRLIGRRCHDCTPGQNICVGKDGYAVCEATKAGCNAWVTVLACPQDQSCREGQCMQGCTDQCKPEERRCSGNNGAQVCVKNAAGCYVWNEPVLCDTGQVCNNGRCRRPEPVARTQPDKPAAPVEQLVRGDIISVGSDGGRRVLYIRVAEGSGVQPGQSGNVLDGSSDKPLSGGDISVLSISGTTVKASTRLESVGNNRRVTIRVSK